MKNIRLKKELIFMPILILPILYIVYIWPLLPDQIAIHFNLHGEANGWGSRASIILAPLMNIGIYLLILFLPLIDPKRMNTEEVNSIFYKIRLGIVTFMSVMSVVAAQAAIHGAMDKGLSHYIPVAVFLLFTFVGNLMINIKPNWFIGIRTPWTLSSDSVWRQTHQVFGKLWFYGGLLCAGLCFFLPDHWVVILILIFALGSTVSAFAYSFWLFRKEKSRTIDHKSEV